MRARSKATKTRAAWPKPAGQPPEGHIEVIARGVLLHGGAVLVCENLKHGYVYLPGGHVEFGESAAAALEREFLEECGAKVKTAHLLLADEGTFATKKRRHHELNLVFHVELVGGDPRRIKSLEKDIAFRWLDLAAVPEADLRPLAAKALLSAGVREPSQGAEWVSAIGHPH